MKDRHKAILALTAVAAIWGIAIPIIKTTLQYTPPFTFVFFRLLIASLIVSPFLISQIKHQEFKKKDLGRLFLLSIFGQTIHLSLIFLGFNRTTAIEGSIIASIIPVFTIIGGVWILKETVTRLEKIGIAVILLGTAVTFTDSIQQFSSGAGETLTGNILLVLAGLSWTAFAILSKELFERYDPLPITALTFFVGVTTFIPLMIWELWFSAPSVELNLIKAAPGILYMGALSSVVAYGLYEVALEYIEASEADIFSYLVPLFAAPVSFLMLGEKPTLFLLIGGVIIAMGVLISNKGSSNQRKHIRRGKI